MASVGASIQQKSGWTEQYLADLDVRFNQIGSCYFDHGSMPMGPYFNLI